MSFLVAKSTFAYSWLFVILLGLRWSLARAAACYAPPQPVNGKSRPYYCQDENCKIAEGTAMEPGDALDYSCNSGYRLEGSGSVFCRSTGNWSEYPRCVEIKCGRLNSESILADCRRLGDIVDCNFPVPRHTRADLKCRPGYEKSASLLFPQSEVLTCTEDGKWQPENALTCVPKCGQTRIRQRPLIHKGYSADIADFPWHATLYMQKDLSEESEKEFICGSTIIRANLLLTAAHCVYDESTEATVDPRKLFVMTGNTFRDYDYQYHNPAVVRKGVVKNVYVHCDYHGIMGSYLSDIALLQLQNSFRLSSTLIPACLTDLKSSTLILEPGVTGSVPGFGRTETGDSSGLLRAITLPYVAYSQCRGSVNTDRNSAFITSEKFCAGFNNGSAVCSGDSGGGLVFQRDHVWYLMGIVSVGLGYDSSSGEATCNPSSYSLYTKVSYHIQWISDLISDLKNGQPPPPCVIRSLSTPPTQTTALPQTTRIQTTQMPTIQMPTTQMPMTQMQTTEMLSTTFRPIIVQTEPVISKFCMTPPQPNNGQWKLHRSLCDGLDGQNQNCKIPSDAEAPPGTALVYRCNPGYKLEGRTIVSCKHNRSWSVQPVCIAE